LDLVSSNTGDINFFLQFVIGTLASYSNNYYRQTMSFIRRRKKKNRKAEKEYNEALWKAYPKKKEKDDE